MKAIYWQTEHQAFRVCIDCGEPLPRRGNKPAERCRSCNAKAMGQRRMRRHKWRRREKADKYEVVEETMRRPDGTRFKIVKVLEKGTCKIIGKREIELEPARALRGCRN